MSSEESPPSRKKNYDDISFERRKKLIDLIIEEKWTIKDAAKKIGIKHSTAKHILYLFRRHDKIVQKKPKPLICTHSSHHHGNENESPNYSPQYILVPFPVYVLCSDQTSQVPINLEHNEARS